MTQKQKPILIICMLFLNYECNIHVQKDDTNHRFQEHNNLHIVKIAWRTNAPDYEVSNFPNYISILKKLLIWKTLGSIVSCNCVHVQVLANFSSLQPWINMLQICFPLQNRSLLCYAPLLAFPSFPLSTIYTGGTWKLNHGQTIWN